jgi:hypothetical protein
MKHAFIGLLQMVYLMPLPRLHLNWHSKGLVCTYEVLLKSRVLYGIFDQASFSSHTSKAFAVLMLISLSELAGSYEGDVKEIHLTTRFVILLSYRAR